MNVKDLKISPLFELRKKHNEELIAIEGYVGDKAAGMIHLFPNLDANNFYEIPEKTILSLEKACKECENDERIRIYVLASTEIKIIQKMQAKFIPNGPSNPFGLPEFQRFILPNKVPSIHDAIFDPKGDLNGYFERIQCIQSCIKEIRMRDELFNDSCVNGYKARTLKSIGHKALRSCLEKCGFSGHRLNSVYANAVKQLEVTYYHIPCGDIGPITDDFYPPITNLPSF